MGWNTNGTGAGSVGLPLLIFIPTCCGRASTMPCTFPVGSLAATLPHAWGWPQVQGLGIPCGDPAAWLYLSGQQCTQE